MQYTRREGLSTEDDLRGQGGKSGDPSDRTFCAVMELGSPSNSDTTIMHGINREGSIRKDIFATTWNPILIESGAAISATHKMTHVGGERTNFTLLDRSLKEIANSIRPRQPFHNAHDYP